MSIFTMYQALIAVLAVCSSSLWTRGHGSVRRETYIVHVAEPENVVDAGDLEAWYSSFLPETMGVTEGKPRIVHSYKNVFAGFAAELSAGELEILRQRKGFVSASVERVLPLHTTRSPGFLGLHQNYGVWKESGYGRGVVVAVLDTGVFPDHPSFSGRGMPPPPSKWKGTCEFKPRACNNKLIGARSFVFDDNGPIDSNGHGTHAASTVAGRFVTGANVLGSARGTAVGIAPMAHIAVYRTCSDDCLESDVLAAMDAAIEDGVDVISISFGGFPRGFHDDNIAIGAYKAMQKGIFVSCSAGNNGPSPATLSNEAPWILTAGASTIDRRIKATAVLGNRVQISGESAFQPLNWRAAQLPLVFPGANVSNHAALYCSKESLFNTKVKGKIVLCSTDSRTSQIEQGRIVKEAGAAGMILKNMEFQGFTTSATAHVLPATNVDYEAGERVIQYINSTPNSKTPTAAIMFQGTVIGEKEAPMVAPFSSRGPGYVVRGIPKPDIIGPGVDILGAWSNSGDFNIISGTSVSSAHLAGVAALIKNLHPNWSPAAIKSAMMTTAYITTNGNHPILDEHRHPADIFSTGSGHVNPASAADPGLIYDLQPEDYIQYLCSLNYTSHQISIITSQTSRCSSETGAGQLNYPSFAVRIGEANQRLTRTVTNVGDLDEVYSSEIFAPEGIQVTVTPPRLVFSAKNQKLKYEATFTVTGSDWSHGPPPQGYITWKSAKHLVRSHFVATLD